jgi:Family of unknown function (DUF6502)
MSTAENARIGNRRARSRPSPLSEPARQALGHVVRILAHCGSRPQDIVSGVQEECEHIPRHWGAEARRAPREINDAAHVLTVWFGEAAYLDADGRPRPLPFEGASTSVAALVRSVDRKLDPREVLRYLVRSGAVRRQGTRYLPRKRFLRLRGTQAYLFTLRTLNNMLGTIQHNLHRKRTEPALFEYSVDNPRFPVSKLPQLNEYVKALGGETLTGVDLHLRQRETMRRKGEPTVRVGLGFYVWRDPVRSVSRGRRSRKHKRVAPGKAR